jgi:hypothetical protein
MPRFVILEHDFPTLHWDLLVERDGVLVSWRLASPPRLDEAFTAQAAAPHRMFYLDHQGPVSGGRGFVTRWDGGDCLWLENEPDRVRIRLKGSQIVGELLLSGSGDTWLGVVRAVAEGL